MNPPAAVAHLSDGGLPIETYWFQYPSVDDLLKSLRNCSLVFEDGWALGGIDLRSLLKRVGLENMDDFCSTSPRTLHLSGGVPAQAVAQLYTGAEEIIRMVHEQMAEEIQEIRDMRDEHARIREYRARCVEEEVE